MFKVTDKRHNHEFTDIDREMAVLNKRRKADIKRGELELARLDNKKLKLEREQEIEDLKDDLGLNDDDDEEGNSFEDKIGEQFMNLMMSKISGNVDNTNSTSMNSPQENPLSTFPGNITQEKMDRLKEEIPTKYLKKAYEIMKT